jgi:S1-C subfamily serine protease
VALADRNNDLAILRIDNEAFRVSAPAQIPFSIKDELSAVGEDIFVLGYPLVWAMGDNIKVTDGIVSSSTGFQNDPATYQISAAVQPGNSGAPVFDRSGSLIGIVNAKISQADNVGYSVKASYVLNLLSLLPDIEVTSPSGSGRRVELTKLVQDFSDYVTLISVTK